MIKLFIPLCLETSRDVNVHTQFGEYSSRHFGRDYDANWDTLPNLVCVRDNEVRDTHCTGNVKWAND